MSTTAQGTRAVIYDRVSEADPSSQAEHVRHCRQEVEHRGWHVVEETDIASGNKRGTSDSLRR